MIELSAIDAIASTVADDAFSFIGIAAFGGVAGQLRWEDQGPVRLIQDGVNGDPTADLTIFVNSAGSMDANSERVNDFDTAGFGI